jgi:structural maintenance of chromosomes protein 5
MPGDPRPFIKEVILENFMSYEYARIPLGPLVNIICGPNGAGKSTILMGISVALGQTYTERSRKLSELIRRGKDLGRATIVIDNSSKNGRRPVPSIAKDNIILSRFLRRDGEYWFELDSRAAEKTEVVRLLRRLGINPDNLLIIMHQNMVEEFTVLPSEEKLRVVEEASGLASYRRDVLDSRRKLSRILSEEESLTKLLESSEQTLSYWKNQYQQLQTKRQLRLKKNYLEQSLAWKEVSEVETRVTEFKQSIAQAEAVIRELNTQIADLTEELAAMRANLREFDRRALQAESEIADKIVSQIEAKIDKASPALITTHTSSRSGGSAESESYTIDREELDRIFHSIIKGKNGDSEIDGGSLPSGFLTAAETYAELRVKDALKRSQLAAEEANLQSFRGELIHAQSQVDTLVKRAETFGPKRDSEKTPKQLFEELKITEGHLAALNEVSEDVERLYESYVKLHDEILAKAQIVSDNRTKLMEEIETRIQKWQEVMRDLTTKTSLRYGEILSNVGAVGSVQLTLAEDIESAGLELLVGFRGASPVSLNAYTQSGGERSTATVAFLLALQEFIKSPFRGIDEFDIHMDPRNRETIMRVLYATVKDSQTQYVAITPSPLTVLAEDAHILTVQSSAGRSEVKEVA